MSVKVTYGEMWAEAYSRAAAADDRLREYTRLDDMLEPVHPEHVKRAEHTKAVATAQANLIAFCERNVDLVKKRISEELAEAQARERAVTQQQDEQPMESAS